MRNSDYMGKPYSFRQHLEGGHRCWRLKLLAGDRGQTDLIYTKGYEGRGVMEGVRYGLWIGLLVTPGMAYGTYAMIAIPHLLALEWLVLGIVEFILLGVVVALIYRPRSA